ERFEILGDFATLCKFRSRHPFYQCCAGQATLHCRGRLRYTAATYKKLYYTRTGNGSQKATQFDSHSL
ncbi:MAG: hypothetical protein KDE58_39835, partial [Caldilineaceae bacterium]|nr:hypothetical protein [Caldilineaceae bacterium]